LDKAGLSQTDSEGYRLRTDGTGRLRLEIQTLGGQFIQYTRICKMIRDQWKRIGIDLTVQENERSLAERRNIANENQLYTFVADGSEHLFTFPDNIFPYQPIGGSGAQYALWFQSNGAQGKEPPERMKRVMIEFKRAFGVQESERVEIGKEIWRTLTDEVYRIGVIGLSPAAMGVRIVKNNVGNVPSRQYNSPDGKTPAISRPTTFFFKS
jgi:peptide/nickel transport system substrate-binding protein